MGILLFALQSVFLAPARAQVIDPLQAEDARKAVDASCKREQDCLIDPYCGDPLRSEYRVICEDNKRIFSKAASVEQLLSCGASCSARAFAEARSRIVPLIGSCAKLTSCGLLSWLLSLQAAADPANHNFQNEEDIEGAIGPLEKSFSRLGKQLQALMEGSWTPGDCALELRRGLSAFNWKAGAVAADLDAIQYRLILDGNYEPGRDSGFQKRINALSEQIEPMRARLRGMADLRCPGLTARWRTETMLAAAIPALRLKEIRINAPDFDSRPPFANAPAVWAGLMDKPRAPNIGNPRQRADILFGQKDQDCGVVVQQEILTAAGFVDPRAPSENEKRLLKEARALGLALRDGGVYSELLGALLVRHGLSIVRNDHAGKEALIAPVRRGNWVLVTVDAGILWDQPESLGEYHAVVVTGAAVGTGPGNVEGFYINDSGNSVASLVPAKKFLAAWQASGATLVVAD